MINARQKSEVNLSNVNEGNKCSDSQTSSKNMKNLEKLVLIARHKHLNRNETSKDTIELMSPTETDKMFK